MSVCEKSWEMIGLIRQKLSKQTKKQKLSDFVHILADNYWTTVEPLLANSSLTNVTADGHFLHLPAKLHKMVGPMCLIVVLHCSE